MTPKLSIIVPVYNEEVTLKMMMDRIVVALPEAHIIYVDDGSKDSSLSILKKHARPEDIVLTKENGGKGSAVRLGIEHATGTYTAIQDADLEYDPAEIKTMLREAKKYPHTVIFGSRFLQTNPNIYKRYLLGNKLVSWLVSVLFHARITDAYTCYKLFETQKLKQFPLTANGFELEAELSAYPLKNNITIREIPISYNPRTLAEGKKIRCQDAIKGLWTLLRIRFTAQKVESKILSKYENIHDDRLG